MENTGTVEAHKRLLKAEYLVHLNWQHILSKRNFSRYRKTNAWFKLY